MATVTRVFLVPTDVLSVYGYHRPMKRNFLALGQELQNFVES